MSATPHRASDGSGAMFDRIAARYDLLNRLISFGMDRSWRRALIEAASAGGAPRELLDVATGTADVALALADHYPSARVVGLDPSTGMLDVGRGKVTADGFDGRVTLVEGDAQAMPFDDGRFDGCTIAFGIRNVPDRAKGLAEMRRVTRPGGHVAVLELGEPRDSWAAPLARVHIHKVVPAVGAWVSGDDAYRYLEASIAAFPPADAFAAMMRDAGLVDVKVRAFAFGSAHLYVGRVPL